MERITQAFLNCEKLQASRPFPVHVRAACTRSTTGNLLYHGCVPYERGRNLYQSKCVRKRKYSGKALYDVLENYARKGYYAIDPGGRKRGWISCGLSGKNQNSRCLEKQK